MRWFVAKEAMALGYGGIQTMYALTGISRPTIIRGCKELKGEEKLDVAEGIRAPGAGRPCIDDKDPKFDAALRKIMHETTAGDPMSALRWTCKSTTKIAEELTKQGHRVSQRTVHRKLGDLGYSLQLNVKYKEGTSKFTKDRDNQFHTINAVVKDYLKKGDPIISVDTKKKEQIGEFKNNGRAWRHKGDPCKVNVYDFPSLAKGQAIPYGAYDIGRNEGFVNVGMTHDTAEFAVHSIRQWWLQMGRQHYPNAQRLFICADGGGSNGSRVRAWKYYLQQLSDAIALDIQVCHYPPGTSKWNKIEHRMFSYISLHWKGEPLTTYETVVNLIGKTTTKQGLKVKAKLDKRNYKTGTKISDKDMESLNIEYNTFKPQWNYTLKPRKQEKMEKDRSKSYFG